MEKIDPTALAQLLRQCQGVLEVHPAAALRRYPHANEEGLSRCTRGARLRLAGLVVSSPERFQPWHSLLDRLDDLEKKTESGPGSAGRRAPFILSAVGLWPE